MYVLVRISLTELVGWDIVNNIVQAPRTVENFRSLATGELGVNEKGVALHYKNTTFHRVVHGLLVQGGDILSKSSTPLTKVLSWYVLWC